MFELQGHRGARGLRPENTLPSFEYALDVGVTSIETDVHLTADDVAVLAHDPFLEPPLCTTNVDKVLLRRLTLEQLRRHRVDGNPDPVRFPDQRPEIGPLTALLADVDRLEPYRVPTVVELFALAVAYAGEAGERTGKSAEQRERARRVLFDLELKRVPFWPETIGDDFTGQQPGRLENVILAEIRRAGVFERCRVRSFDHRALAAMHRLEPTLTLAVLMSDTAPVAPGELTRQTGSHLYCPDYRFLDADLIGRAHAAGVRVLPWTVNERAHGERLRSWGVDGITTDFPERFRDLV